MNSQFTEQSKAPHGIPPGNSGGESGNKGSEPGKKSNPMLVLIIAVAIAFLAMGLVAFIVAFLSAK